MNGRPQPARPAYNPLLALQRSQFTATQDRHRQIRSLRFLSNVCIGIALMLCVPAVLMISTPAAQARLIQWMVQHPAFDFSALQLVAALAGYLDGALVIAIFILGVVLVLKGAASAGMWRIVFALFIYPAGCYALAWLFAREFGIEAY